MVSRHPRPPSRTLTLPEHPGTEGLQRASVLLREHPRIRSSGRGRPGKGEAEGTLPQVPQLRSANGCLQVQSTVLKPALPPSSLISQRSVRSTSNVSGQHGLLSSRGHASGAEQRPAQHIWFWGIVPKPLTVSRGHNYRIQSGQ